MVGRHSCFLVTKRSLRNSDSANGRRLRQVVQTKNLDDSVGLSRREEQELNKALYASLQENRRCKVLPGFVDVSSSGNSSSSRSSIKGSRTNSDGCSTTTTLSSCSSSVRVSSINKAQKLGHTRKHSFLPGNLPQKRLPRQIELTANLSLDESSQDSVRSSTSSHNGSKKKIHAQRKFAQGCSLPGMVSCTLVKSSAPSVKMLSSKVPKTEDFLTFLCLRGSSILPPHLDFFNFSREEPPSCEEISRPISYSVKDQREGTPDSSSTSSGANEEVAEAANVSTPSMTGRNSRGFLAKRSAARASAGTPETARGIVSLRQGLHRKVATSSTSSSLARSPASSSCLLPVTELTNIPPSRHKNKFYFTPEKSPSPSKASGIRTGEFTPPSMFSSATHMSSTYKFSPLVCSPSKFALNDLPFRPPVNQSSTSPSSSSLSTSSVYDASKRKRRLTNSSDAASTKVTCNHGSSIPSFRVMKCTRLDLDCLSSLTSASLPPSSLPVASTPSSPISCTSSFFSKSSRPSSYSSKHPSHFSHSVTSVPASTIPTCTTFRPKRSSIHLFGQEHRSDVHSTCYEPLTSSPESNHTSHRLNPVQEKHTLVDSYGICTSNNCPDKDDFQHFNTRSDVNTHTSHHNCLYHNISHPDHLVDPHPYASNSHCANCCFLHGCSSPRANPNMVHACHFLNSNHCKFDSVHALNKSDIGQSTSAHCLCHLEILNRAPTSESLTSTMSGSEHSTRNSPHADSRCTSPEEHEHNNVDKYESDCEFLVHHDLDLDDSVLDIRSDLNSDDDNFENRHCSDYCNAAFTEDSNLCGEDSREDSELEMSNLNVNIEDSFDNVSFSVVRPVKQNCSESKSYNNLMRVRRKKRKKHYKYGKRRNKHKMSERRRRKIKKRYCLVKEVPKVKIRIVRRQSVTAAEVSADFVEARTCDLEESNGDGNNKSHNGDFQNEFLKMLHAGGIACLSERKKQLVDSCHKEQLTSVPNVRTSPNDFGHKNSRSQYVYPSAQCEVTHVPFDISDSYSDCDADSIDQHYNSTGEINLRFLECNKAGGILAEYFSESSNTYQNDHAECVSQFTEDEQMLSDVMSMTPQSQQVLFDNLEDFFPIQDNTKSHQLLDETSISIEESAGLADSITVRDKVISAFSKFNRKDIIHNSIEGRKSLTELDILESVNNNLSDNENIDSELGVKLVDSDLIHKLPECQFDEKVLECCSLEKQTSSFVGNCQDSDVECTKFESSRRTDMDIIDKHLNSVSTQTGIFESTGSDLCQETEIIVTGNLANKQEKGSSKGEEFNQSEIYNFCGLDLRKCSDVQSLNCGSRPLKNQKKIEACGPTKTTQTNLEIDVENDKESFTTTHMLDCEEVRNSTTNKLDEDLVIENCESSRVKMRCSHCQDYVYQRVSETKSTDVHDIDRDLHSTEKKFTTKDRDLQNSKCDANNTSCKTISQKILISTDESSCLGRCKAAIHLVRKPEDKQVIRKMKDVESHPNKEAEIQDNSKNNVCHICKTICNSGENSVTNNPTWQIKTNIEKQILPKYIMESEVTFGQQKNSEVLRVNVCTQTDHELNGMNKQLISINNHSPRIEVEQSHNSRSVKIQVSSCDSDPSDVCTSGCTRPSEFKDMETFKDVSIIKIVDGRSSDNLVLGNKSRMNCEINPDISCRHSDMTLHCKSLPPARTQNTEMTLHPSTSQKKDTTQYNLYSSITISFHEPEKKKSTVNHQIADEVLNLSSEVRKSDHTDINKYNDVSYPSDCSPPEEFRAKNFSLKTQKETKGLSCSQLCTKQGRSSGNRAQIIEQQPGCYVNHVPESNLGNGVNKHGRRQTNHTEEKESENIILDDIFKDNILDDGRGCFTDVSLCSEINDNDCFVIDLSIRGRSDNIDNCSKNCNVSSIATSCNNSSHVAEQFDHTDSNSTSICSSDNELAHGIDCDFEDNSSTLLDLRQVATRDLEVELASNRYLECPEEGNHDAKTVDNSKDCIASTYGNFPLKDFSTDDCTQKTYLPQNKSSMKDTSRSVKNNMADINKPSNIGGIFTKFKKIGNESNSLFCGGNLSFQQMRCEKSDENVNLYSQIIPKQDEENSYSDNDLDKEVPKKEFHDSFDIKEQISSPEGRQLANDNAIVLHSYGSLNTGQGFAMVNGQLQQCEILNKGQLQSDIPEDETTVKLQNKSKNKHSITEALTSAVMECLRPPKSAVQSKHLCQSEKKGEDMNITAARQQNIYKNKYEHPENTAVLPIVNSINGRSGDHSDRLTVLQHTSMSSKREHISSMQNKMPADSLELTSTQECLDLSRRFEQVQISPCKYIDAAASLHRKEPVKNILSGSDFNKFEFVIKPKHQSQSITSKRYQRSSQNKYLHMELPNQYALKNRFLSQKDDRSPNQQDLNLTQAPGAISEDCSSVRSSLSNGSWTHFNQPRKVNKPRSLKSYSFARVGNNRIRNYSDFNSDKNILRSAYISDLANLKQEGLNSSHELAHSYNHYDQHHAIVPNRRCFSSHKDNRSVKIIGVPERNTANKTYQLRSEPTELDVDRTIAGLNLPNPPFQNYPYANNSGSSNSSWKIHDRNGYLLSSSSQSDDALLQTIQSSEQHLSHLQFSEASVFPASVLTSTNVPVNSDCPLISQQNLPSICRSDIPLSIPSSAYMTEGKDSNENVLDVIMEELKIQIALLKEEIMRDNQQQTATMDYSRSRGGRNNGVPRMAARARNKKNPLSIQRRKANRHSVRQFDQQMFLFNRNLDMASIGTDLNSQDYDYFSKGDVMSRIGSEMTNTGDLLITSGNLLINSGHLLSNSGNILCNSGIWMLDCGTKVTTSSEDSVTSEQMSSSGSKITSSSDTIFRSEEQVSRDADEGLINGARRIMEETGINLILASKSEPSEYIEISSDGEDLSAASI